MTQAVQQTILCPICRSQNRADARFCQHCGSDVLLDNIYRITKIIKEGGMGMVYKAIDAAGVEYALKEMHDRFSTPEEREKGIADFIEEAQLLAALDHPAIPKVYRSFIDEGRYYLAMEFIYGEDLEDVLKRVTSFPEETVLRWSDQICDVLEYMHSNGLVYRDMKPANIMIDRDENVKLVDFGIAKVLQPGQRNTMVGTPGYAPPEQYQGLATPASDIYALGSTLHHLLTGRDPRDHPPFTFPPARSINPAISEQTSRAIEKALQMEMGQRFGSVEAFRRALPIPTSDRRPTLPFDLGRHELPPIVRPQRQAAAPGRGQRKQSVPTAEPRPAPAQAARRPAAAQAAPARRKSGRGGFRRFLATTALLAGLAGAGVVYYPTIEPVIRDLTANILPSEAQPAVTYDTQLVTIPVQVTLPEGTSEGDIMRALRQAFVSQVQAQHPGARVNPSSQPAIVGGEEWAPSPPVNGEITYSADVTALIDIPQQP